MQIDIAHLLIGSTTIVASTFIFSHVSTKKLLAEITKNLYPRPETKTKAMTLNYSAPDVEIASALVGKTVRYLAEKSSLTKDGVRVFKVESVEHVGFNKNGKRYATVLARDIDDKGESKYRNLHIAGIDLAI